MKYKQCVSCSMKLEVEKAYETKKIKSCELILDDIAGNRIHSYDFYMCSKCIKRIVTENKIGG